MLPFLPDTRESAAVRDALPSWSGRGRRRGPKPPPWCQAPKAAIWAAALPWLTVRVGVWLS